jgi:predicted small secreted protein
MMRLSRLGAESGRRSLLGIIVLVIVSSFVVAGCDRLTGGGWIQSVEPGERATFSFSARCRNSTVNGQPAALLYQGQFEYDDHAFNPLVRIHGTVVPDTFGTFPLQTCRQLATELDMSSLSRFQGTFRTQPEIIPGVQGEFVVAVSDGGEGGTLNGDEICVSLFGPIVYPPTWCGLVQGGNIQVQ